jgi:tape measure domain-containing protein
MCREHLKKKLRSNGKKRTIRGNVMATGGQLAEFFATFGFKINRTDIQKVDKQLDILEKRARRITEDSLSNIRVNISRFGFSDNFNTRLRRALEARMKLATNQTFRPTIKFARISVPISGIKFSDDFNTRLHRALKARLRLASTRGISPEIHLNRFDVDKYALLRDMREAIRFVEQNARIRIRSIVDRPTGGAGGAGGRGAAGGFAGAGLGAASGGMGRALIPGLGLGFGISKLNQINQELIGQGTAATAVFGTQEKGADQLAWVKKLGNDVGFDYRAQSDPYLKMAAAGTTAGMSTGEVQGVFKGMAEYGRVMGLDNEAMKGSMRAVEQMLNKGQVYSEELKMQLGEKFPAAIQLMAEAVSGGDTAKLFDMMDSGEVNSLTALPKFAKILSEQARKGGALEAAKLTSLAEQMRFNNTFNDMVKELSKSGFEKGQAGIFQTMAAFFKEMLPLVRAFGEAWHYIGAILRVPLGLLVDLSTGIKLLSEHTGMAKGNILALGIVATLLALPFTRLATVIGIALLALEDFSAFIAGRKSLMGELLGDDAENTRKNFLDLFSSLGALLGTIAGHISDIVGLFNESDSPLISLLNGFITQLTELFELLNKLAGGKSKAERIMANDPTRKFFPPTKQETEKSNFESAAGFLANFIGTSSLMFAPRALGLGGLLQSISESGVNRTRDMAERNRQLGLPEGSSVMDSLTNQYNSDGRANMGSFSPDKFGSSSRNSQSTTQNNISIPLTVINSDRIEEYRMVTQEIVDNALRNQYKPLADLSVGSE